MSALGELYDLYGQRIYRLAHSMLHSPSDADDATQDIFMRAWEKAHTFKGESSLFTWLYRLAVRHCLNVLRQRKRHIAHGKKLMTLTQPPSVAIADSGPAGSLAAQECRGQLDGLLSILPPAHRACLVLREVDGFSYGEIAALVGIPEGTVMSRLSRARTALRAHASATDGRIDQRTAVREPLRGAKSA